MELDCVMCPEWNLLCRESAGLRGERDGAALSCPRESLLAALCRRHASFLVLCLALAVEPTGLRRRMETLSSLVLDE